MSTLQLYGQLLRSAQETGNKKAESMASHQQTPNEHSLESAMNHGNFLNGSVGANFSRLTEHLVFAFLGGYVSMDDLPCLGDLANENNWSHGSTPIPMDLHSESSQVESLDLNGNLHQLSAISMDLNFISRIMDYHCESDKISKCYQNPSENISIVLDSFYASSTACSPPEHISQSSDEFELLPENSINAHLICNKSVIDILNLDYPNPSMPFQQCDFTGKFVMSTIDAGLPYCSLGSNSHPDTLCKKLAFKLQKIGGDHKTEIQEYDLHKHALTSENLESQFHRHLERCSGQNLKDVPGSNLCSTNALTKNGPINDGNTFAIPKPGTLMDYLSGDLEIPQFLNTEPFGMQSKDSCCTIGNNGEGPTYSVPDPSQLMNFLYGDLESPVFLSSESIEEEVPIYAEYDGNYSKLEVISQSADHTNEESHQCSTMYSLAIPETTFGLMTISLCDSNGFTDGMDFERVRIPSNSQSAEKTSDISDPKLSYHQDVFNVADHSKKYISEVHNASATKSNGYFLKNPTTFFLTTSPLFHKSEDDKENMKTDLSPSASNTDEPSLMNKNPASNSHENPEIYVPSPCCDQKVCKSNSSMFDHPCLLGDYDLDDDAEVADLSDCTLNLLCCGAITYNTLNLPIESKNGSLAEAFEGNEITPTSSALLDCNGEKIGSDSSFFDSSEHDNLLEMYGLSNKDEWTDTSYNCESPSWPGKLERQLQKSPTCLIPNLTKDDNADGALTADSSLFHSNTDETSAMNKKWTDEINKRNSEISVSPCYLNQMECAFETYFFPNDKKFAFPDPSKLKHFFCGSLDSPKYLAPEFLDGQIDTLDYSSLLGDCEQNDRTEEADLSDKIFDQCYDVVSTKNDGSINKFSCSIQLFDLIPTSFDISDHDEFLEWYGINDQDQFIDGNWTCDSPTWPGKI